MTQKELTLKYVSEFGFIIPAKNIGRSYGGGFFGAELSRVCRALRKEGVLDSYKDGKFERFYFKAKINDVVSRINAMSPFSEKKEKKESQESKDPNRTNTLF
jgi:hypothetical protein